MDKKHHHIGHCDFNIYYPDCPFLSLSINFFTFVSEEYRAHDVLLFNGHVFPWLSPVDQVKPEYLHCERQS